MVFWGILFSIIGFLLFIAFIAFIIWVVWKLFFKKDTTNVVVIDGKVHELPPGRLNVKNT